MSDSLPVREFHLLTLAEESWNWWLPLKLFSFHLVAQNTFISCLLFVSSSRNKLHAFSSQHTVFFSISPGLRSGLVHSVPCVCVFTVLAIIGFIQCVCMCVYIFHYHWIHPVLQTHNLLTSHGSGSLCSPKWKSALLSFVAEKSRSQPSFLWVERPS